MHGDYWCLFTIFDTQAQPLAVLLHGRELAHEPSLLNGSEMIELVGLDESLQPLCAVVEFGVLDVHTVEERFGLTVGLLEDLSGRPRVVGGAVGVGVLDMIAVASFVAVGVVAGEALCYCGLFVHRFGQDLFCSDVVFHCFCDLYVLFIAITMRWSHLCPMPTQ